MKKVAVLIIMGLVLAGLSGRINAQKDSKPFEGTVKFGISIEGGNLSEADKAQIPNEENVTIKGNKVKEEVKTIMFGQTTILDNEKKEMLYLISVESAGMKKYLKMTKEDLDKKNKSLPTYDLKEVAETKVVAGYTCKKAELTDEEGNVTVVYYTNDINIPDCNWENPVMKNIKGYPLEYSQPAGSSTIKYIAKEVKKKKIKDNEFEIPEGFTEMTKEEAAQMGGGM